MLSIIYIDTLKYDPEPIFISSNTLGDLISKVYWFSDRPFPCENKLPVPVIWTEIPRIQNFNEDYGNLALKLCPLICTEPHNLTIHNDGFAVNKEAWTNDFLNFDYIGACWGDGFVGNGGFTLRSRKLYDALLDMDVAFDSQSYTDYMDNDFYYVITNGKKFIPEDNIICKIHKKTLEDKYDIRFAPPALADRFCIEHNLSSPWLGKSLGFHGKHGVHKYYGVNLNI